MRKPLAVLAALGLTASLATVTLPAQADTPCTITSYSPRSTVVGLSPKVVKFNVTTSGCSRAGWTVEGDDFFVYDGSPEWVFNPYSNAQAAPQDAVVEAYNADYDSRAKVFANSFTVKRNAGWDQFNATPEPVRKGSKITLSGRLRIADWTNDRYVGFSNRTVSVEFRTKTGTYRQVKTVTTGTGGYLKTTVTANQDGFWRLRYSGNSYSGAGVGAADYVDVK